MLIFSWEYSWRHSKAFTSSFLLADLLAVIVLLLDQVPQHLLAHEPAHVVLCVLAKDMEMSYLILPTSSEHYR
jgi:hypothetical protein